MRAGLIAFASLLLVASPLVYAQDDAGPVPWTAIDDSELGQVTFAPLKGVDQGNGFQV